MSVNIIKKGRIDAIEVSVDIHAPPIPKDNSINGARQQADAAIAENAASIASQNECLADILSSVFSTMG